MKEDRYGARERRMEFCDLPAVQDLAVRPNLLVKHIVRHLVCSCDCSCDVLLSLVVYELLPKNLYFLTLSFMTLSLSKQTLISMYTLPRGGI